jgi:hypothetical protein
VDGQACGSSDDCVMQSTGFNRKTFEHACRKNEGQSKLSKAGGLKDTQAEAGCTWVTPLLYMMWTTAAGTTQWRRNERESLMLMRDLRLKPSALGPLCVPRFNGPLLLFTCMRAHGALFWFCVNRDCYIPTNDIQFSGQFLSSLCFL